MAFGNTELNILLHYYKSRDNISTLNKFILKVTSFSSSCYKVFFLFYFYSLLSHIGCANLLTSFFLFFPFPPVLQLLE